MKNSLGFVMSNPCIQAKAFKKQTEAPQTCCIQKQKSCFSKFSSCMYTSYLTWLLLFRWQIRWGYVAPTICHISWKLFPHLIYNFHKTGLSMEAFIWSCKCTSKVLKHMKKIKLKPKDNSELYEKKNFSITNKTTVAAPPVKKRVRVPLTIREVRHYLWNW